MVMSLVTSLPLILVMMTVGVDGQQFWTVNYSPSYVCVLKGSTVNLSCTVKYPHDHQLNTVSWTKPTAGVTELPDLCSGPEKRGRVQCVSKDKDTYSLTLMNVTEADKHIYYCRFTTDRGTWTGIPGAQLDVTDLQVETEQSVKERDSVTLRCKSSCSLPQQTTFIWFRNTERLTSGIITENQLHLKSASLHDSGNYQCAVSGHQRLISPPVYINVGYPPRSVRVSISPSAEIVEGDSVTLSCSSDSNPPALNFSWFKENQSSAVGSGQSLIISSFNSSHSGRYYCEAQNQHGSQRSASVSLTSAGGQKTALYAAAGIGAVLVCICIIIVVIKIKRRKTEDAGISKQENSSTAEMDQTSTKPSETADPNDLVYASVAHSRDRKPQRDEDEVQYASVQLHRNTTKEAGCQNRNALSDGSNAETVDDSSVIYSSVKVA